MTTLGGKWKLNSDGNKESYEGAWKDLDGFKTHLDLCKDVLDEKAQLEHDELRVFSIRLIFIFKNIGKHGQMISYSLGCLESHKQLSVLLR